MPQPLPLSTPAPPNAAVTTPNPDLPQGPAARDLAFIGERLASNAQNPLANIRGLERATSTAALPTAADTPSPPATVLPAAQRLRELDEYRARLAQRGVAQPGATPFPTARAAADAARDLPPGLATNRWTPLGPLGVQARPYGRITAYSGRVSGIALAPGGRRIYIATANGGVWRSEDGGSTWQSLMDAFDLNPTAHQSDSLACGAIALVAGEWTRPGSDLCRFGGSARFARCLLWRWADCFNRWRAELVYRAERATAAGHGLLCAGR